MAKHLKTGPLAPDVRRWAAAAKSDDRRTVTIQVARRLSPEEACARLRALEIEVMSPAQGAVSAMVTPGALQALATKRWIIRVEFPKLLGQRSPLSTS